jgi:hypothetical protein
MFAALLTAAPAAADADGATFVSAAQVGDLVCPAAGTHPPKVTGPPRMAHETNTLVPTLAELGDLANFVERPPPALDLAAIPEFALKDGATPRPRRIAFWGDSHIAAGPLMAQLLGAIRDHNETVGTRFLPPTMGRANVRLPTLHAYCIGHGWSTALAYKEAQVQPVGPALASRIAAAGADSYLWLDFRSAAHEAKLRQVALVYRPPASETALAISVNDGPEQTVTLTGDAFAVRADAPIATVRLRVVRGEIALQGFRLDYAEPPLVTFDVFGLPSSTARGWANADTAAISEALQGESYDAVALEYGTNEGSDLAFDAGKYAADLTRTLGNMRKVFPNASCVLIGPPDRGVLLDRYGGHPDLLQFSHIHQQIAAVQAATGAKFGCIAWNWQDYMGGPGGSYGWAHAEPELMGRDLTHMTADGYKRVGAALAKSLGWTDDLFP